MRGQSIILINMIIKVVTVITTVIFSTINNGDVNDINNDEDIRETMVIIELTIIVMIM